MKFHVETLSEKISKKTDNFKDNFGDEINLWRNIMFNRKEFYLKSLENIWIKINNYGNIRLKELFDRDWVRIKNEENIYGWRIETSYCSSQQDIVCINDVLTIIDNNIILIKFFNFGTNSMMDIDRICCYEIEKIE